MRVVVLASGSTGNCTFFSCNGKNILLDCGRNAKYVSDKLESIGVSARDIDAILISHTHDDHVSALRVFLKKSHAKVYLTEKMFYDLDYLQDYNNVVVFNDNFYIDNIKVTPFKGSHDSSDHRSYLLENGDESVVYLTDTGYLNSKYFKMLQNRTYYLMESNHDIEMLMNGPYPKWLKQRVLGTLGHLSNKDSSFYLSKLIGTNTKKVILMHLSEHNNTPLKALEMFNETMQEYGVSFDDVECAKPDEIVEVTSDQNIMSR